VELPEGVDYEGVFGPAGEPEVARRMAVPAAPAGLGSGLSSFGGRMLRERAQPMAPPPPSPAPVRETEEDQAKASVADRADVAAKTCRYTDLSVSGGLRYLQAKARLDKAWPTLCAELARTGAPLPDAAVEVTLRVDAGGRVRAVTLSAPGPLPADLEKALREHLQRLAFAPTAGEATLTLRLLLGARAASR
jgi:hypothetical protein